MTTTNFDYADPLITEIESYKNRLAMVEDERDYLMNNCDRYIEQLGDLKTQVDSLKQINNDLYTKHIQMRDAFSKLINQCTQLRSVEMYHAGIDLDEAIYVLDGKGHV